MYQKILLAVDGSESSTLAVRKMADFQAQWNAEIVIFSSINHQIPLRTFRLPFLNNMGLPYQIPDLSYEQIQFIYKSFAEKNVNQALQIFEDNSVGEKVSTRIIELQEPAEYAKDIVDAEGFDLTVLGAHGQHSKLHEVFMGSVCEKIMNQVSSDVLVVKAEGQENVQKYQNILLATDGSEQSLKAAKILAEMLPQWNASIVIFFSMMHRKPFGDIPAPFLSPFSNKFNDSDGNLFDMNELFMDMGNKILEKTLQIFQDAGITENISTRLIEDEQPNDYVRRIIPEEGFDLVTLGAKGQHSKMHEIFLGSVCEKITNEATCDVLVIK